MTSLLDLPNELLLFIGEACSTGALNSLIQTNRRLAELLDPILWRFQSKRDPDLNRRENYWPTNIWREIDAIVDMIPYANSTNNVLMMKKALQYFNFDRQNTERKRRAFQSSVHWGQYEWVEMLLNGMEKEGQKFDSATVVKAIWKSIWKDYPVICKRLLQHDIIERDKWIEFGQCAMSNFSEELFRVILDYSQCDPIPEQNDLNQLLYDAARLGHVPFLSLLSERGADVNMPGLDYMHRQDTPPIIAAERGNIEAVVWMFQQGAYIDTRKVKKAIMKKATIRKLRKLYSSINRQPETCQRACCDLPRLTRELYNGHCDSSSSPPSYEGLQPGGGFGVKARQFERYLISLAFATSAETISLLLDKIDVAKMGQEILFRASYWRGNKLLIKELLARGLSLTAKCEENNILHSLADGMFDSGDKIQRQHMIDAAGFIIDVRPETLSERGKAGNTPLHIASTHNLYLFDALLERGASADAINDDGQTPYELMRLW